MFIEFWEIALVIRLFDSKLVGTRINQMYGDVLDFSGLKYDLITGDAPVSGGAIGLSTDFLMLPISPTTAFLATGSPL